MNNESPLPYGWIREWDSNQNHAYYIDTRADPPRAIWTHPYEDEQYLREHPDVKEKLGPARSADVLPDRPSTSASPRRSSFPGESSTPRMEPRKKERSFLGKLKDKAIGTKEEREAARAEERRQEELRRQRLMEMQQQRLAYAQQHPQYGPYGGYQGGRQTFMSPQYGPPAGRAGGRMGGMGGMGGMGMGLPLVGGLAGGLLLGEAIDGFGGDGGGDFGGGDGGGGDFGGGDFGGGGDF